MNDINPPSLFEVSEMSRDFGLVGERRSHLSVFCITLNGGLVIMSSPSRSGKDMVVDAVEYCRSGDDIAKIPNSSSQTVLYQKAEELNNSPVHRYPDITDLDDHIESLLKSHGDGNVSTHEYTDITGEQRETVEQTLEPPNSMILFMATDNSKLDLNSFPELRNRAVIVGTDTSADLTERIKRRQGREEVGLYEQRISDGRQAEIRQYNSEIPVPLYTNDTAPGVIWNLTHNAFSIENPLPDLFPESRMDFKRFNKFVKSVTMFKYGKRMQINSPPNNDAGLALLSTPADLWHSWCIFGEKMVLSALNLRDMDFEIMELLREKAQAMTVAEIQTEMRLRDQNLSETQVRGSVEGMLDKGYVYKDQSSSGRVKYQPSPFASAEQVSRSITIDMDSIVEQTKEDAREMLSDENANEYISQYCEGDGLVVTHPFTGDDVNIIDEDIGSNIEESVEEESETVENTDPFANVAAGGENNETLDSNYDDEETEDEMSNGMFNETL